MLLQLCGFHNVIENLECRHYHDLRLTKPWKV